MHFTITHPMHTHPYSPELVTGAGVAAVASAAEAAGFHGRDPATIEITFSNLEGGDPSDDDFTADAYLSGVEKLAALGRHVDPGHHPRRKPCPCARHHRAFRRRSHRESVTRCR
jgi:hypothetical protein